MELTTVNEFEEIVSADSSEKEIIIFKYSPICPISKRIEREFDRWFESKNSDLTLYKINVISSRTLSTHLADYFNITHESPQLIWLDEELKVKANNSHYQIDEEFLNGNL
ncbi:MAG: bacillithiol system redox-active protein YtxJ [Rhodothermaceae bacterium]